METQTKVKKERFRTLKKLNVFNIWRENYKDRLVFLALILGIWILIKAIEELTPQAVLDKLPLNVGLDLLFAVIILMMVHTFYIFVAQFYRRRNPRILKQDHKPSIDIFISAHNEENVIEETLMHMLDHDYHDFKIYAINDRSEDHTLAKMQKAASLSDGKIIIIDREKDAFPGKAAALNDALKISMGEVVCVFDADARVDKGFLNKIVRHLGHPQVGAVQSQKVISNPERNFLTKCQFYEYAHDTYLQMGRDSVKGAAELRGNGQLIKREALLDVGGWNEETLTDDLDLSTCLHLKGWVIRFSPEDKVYEEAVSNIPSLIKQRRRWTEGSIRRYLTYLHRLATPGNLTIHQVFDTFIFVSEFSVPLWVACELGYEMFKVFRGEETYFSFIMLICLFIGCVFFVNQFNGLRLYKKQGIIEAAWNTFITNFYLTAVWISVIMLTYRKILFSRTVGKWSRTEHGT